MYRAVLTVCPLLLVALGPSVRAQEHDGLAERLASVRSEARRLQAEEEALAQQARRAEEELRGHVRALYRLTRAGMLPLAGGFDALLAHAGRVGHLERMVARRQRLLRVLESRRRGLRAERAARARLLAELRDRLAAEREREDVRQREALQEVFRSSRFAPSFAPGSLVGTGFETQRGSLGSPLSGTFRVSRPPQGGEPALLLEGRSGVSVRASVDGRVAFADELPGRGLVVVLDHGGGWFTVYEGLGRIGVQLDDYVGRGADLGALGSAGVLRFEVRRGARAMDPSAWLGF